MIRYILFSLTFAYASAELRYDNYTLYRIVSENEEQVKILRNLQENDGRFNFWGDPSPMLDFVNVMSSPEYKNDLEDFLEKNNIKFTISMSNIQETIDQEKRGTYTIRNLRSIRWDTYYSLNHINIWLDDIIERYSNVASLIIGGESYEGRQIRGIKISHGRGKRAIFIESGIHAREWITVATTNYIIDRLLRSSDDDIKAVVSEYDWYIFPVTNPDGYEWSFTDNRMWRKNRRPLDSAIGVDLNRNWNNNWAIHGVSMNPSAETYPGPGPFSEVESRTLSEYIRSISDQIDLYLSMHSYSQLLLLPFGNSTQGYANYNDAMNIGRRAMGTLSVRYGTQYTTGNIAEAIYLATGGSVDWVKEALKVPLVYCYEFRDRGQYGFLLPASQIIPNSEEVLDSIVDMVFQAKRFGYMNGASSVKLSTFGLLSLFAAVLLK